MSVADFQAEARSGSKPPGIHVGIGPTRSLFISRCWKSYANLRDNAYKTYIVTGGAQDFVRIYAEKVYGIPPERVVGTAEGTSYGYDKSGRPFLTKDPKGDLTTTMRVNRRVFT